MIRGVDRDFMFRSSLQISLMRKAEAISMPKWLRFYKLQLLSGKAANRSIFQSLTEGILKA